MEKKVLIWEPWFFMAFGLFYFTLMGVLAGLSVLGIFTFTKCRGNNYWWRWIYLFGGAYVLFDLYAIAAGLEFWNKLLLWMFDVDSIYWNAVWLFFVLLGGFSFLLGMKLLEQRKG